MRFVPYVLQKYTHSEQCERVGRSQGNQSEQFRILLFLERGRALQIPDDAAATFCAENGFVVRGSVWDLSETHFQQIDSTHTPMAAFYEWNELAEDDPRECWRCFHHAPAYLSWREETDIERLVGEVLRRHAILTIEKDR